MNYLSVDDVVREMYYRDHDEAVAEVEKQPLSLRVSSTHLCLLQELAERFKGYTRSGLGADLLEAAIEQAFASLGKEDRDKLAAKADAAYKEYAKKAYTTFESAGMGYWEGMAFAYSKRATEKAEGEGE